MENVKKRLTKVINEVYEFRIVDINEDANLLLDFGADQYKFFLLNMRIEQEFGLSFKNIDYWDLEFFKISKFLQYIYEHKTI